jgi:hypothetical protein
VRPPQSVDGEKSSRVEIPGVPSWILDQNNRLYLLTAIQSVNKRAL